ncbi:MAG: MerR family transcriptional regulator [Candidatus Ratteibacteria bacterium]|nr:MerR family transcriptional regulator [Candidatus Ratteibacteria bacterium]
MEVNLPKKLYYTLAEAGNFLRVKPHVLRYWDREFKVKQRRKNKKQFQKYHRDDLKKFLEIKSCLYEKLYSVAGAKKKLAEKKRKAVDKDADYRGLLRRVKRGLRLIEAIVK